MVTVLLHLWHTDAATINAMTELMLTFPIIELDEDTVSHEWKIVRKTADCVVFKTTFSRRV